MNTKPLENHAKGQIQIALLAISKFSKDLLTDPETAFRFSGPALEATAKLKVWKDILSRIDAGQTPEVLVARIQDELLARASAGGLSPTGSVEAALNSETIRQTAAAFKKLDNYVKMDGHELAFQA